MYWAELNWLPGPVNNSLLRAACFDPILLPPNEDIESGVAVCIIIMPNNYGPRNVVVSGAERHHRPLYWSLNRADQSHEISQRLMALDLNELIIYKANRQVFQNWDKLDRANVHVKLQMGYNNHYIFMVHYDTAATARFTTTFISISLVFFQFWHHQYSQYSEIHMWII